MQEFYRQSDTQFNFAFGVLEKSKFDNLEYVDIHGYLKWNIVSFETEPGVDIKTGEYSQLIKSDVVKHHRCTNNDKQNFFDFYSLADGFLKEIFPNLQCFDDLN